jgi:hypothetical protein
MSQALRTSLAVSNGKNNGRARILLSVESFCKIVIPYEIQW